MLNFETKPLFVFKAINESSIHPPGVTFATTEAEEKEVFSICCDDGADLVVGGVGGGSQALTLHPFPVLFREADVEVSVSLKDQAASVGRDKGHAFILLGVDFGPTISAPAAVFRLNLFIRLYFLIHGFDDFSSIPSYRTVGKNHPHEFTSKIYGQLKVYLYSAPFRLLQKHVLKKRLIMARSAAAATITHFAQVSGHQTTAKTTMATANKKRQKHNFMMLSSLK